MTSEEMKKQINAMIAHAVLQALSDPINVDEWTAIRVGLQDASNNLDLIDKKAQARVEAANAAHAAEADQMTAKMFCINVRVSSIDPQKRSSLMPKEMKEVIEEGFKQIQQYCKDKENRTINWCNLTFPVGSESINAISKGETLWNDTLFNEWADKMQEFCTQNNKSIDKIFYNIRFVPDLQFDNDKSLEAMTKGMELENGFDRWLRGN